MEADNQLLDFAVGVHEPVRFTTVPMIHDCPVFQQISSYGMLLGINVALVGDPLRAVWARAQCGLCGLDVSVLVENHK